MAKGLNNVSPVQELLLQNAEIESLIRYVWSGPHTFVKLLINIADLLK